MMEIQALDAINVIITAVAGAIGFLAGHRKQKNDFLSELQASINMLAEENKKLMKEVIELRKENADLLGGQEILHNENEKLRKEIGELNEKLSNIKTITRKA